MHAGVSALLAAALAGSAGCGSDGSDAGAVPTAAPKATAGSFEWVSIEQDSQLETAVALGDGFVGQTVEVKPDADETTELPFTITVVVSPDSETWTEPDVPVLGRDELVQWRSGGPWGAVATVSSMNDSPVPELLHPRW